MFNGATNFYNLNNENFHDFLMEMYRKIDLLDKDTNYIRNHLIDELRKELRKIIANGELIVDIESVVDDFLINGLAENKVVTDIKKKLEECSSQLETIEKKLLNPEMFRIQNGIEVDDQTAFNKALEVALLTTKELHYYQDYELNNIIISSTLTLVGHNTKLITKNNVDVFIEVNNNARVYFKDLYVKCDKAKIGILNNDGVLDIDNTYVRGAIEKNVEYRKVGAHGDGQIDKLFTQMSPIGLHLNATDVKVKRLYGFNCLIHVKNSGSGCFLSDCHGWNLKDSSYGDWVTGSTYLVTGKGSIILSDIYADTVETAIELPPSTTDSRYTLINISNFAYFLNRSYYPNGATNPPKLFKNLDTFRGKIGLENLQVDNGAWSDSSGVLAKLFDVRPDETRININGITNNGYSDEFYQVPYMSDFTPVSEDTTYYSPFMRKYRRYKNETKIVIRASMKGGFDTGTLIYSCTLPDNLSLSPNRVANAFINRNVGQINVKCSITKDNKIEVYNDTGLTINNGNLYIYIISDSFI